MASPSHSPNGSRPRAAPQSGPRAALRPVRVEPARRAPTCASPELPDDEAADSSDPRVYALVIGSLAGFCAILVILLVLVVRSDRKPPPSAAPAARQDTAAAHVAAAAPAPAHRDDTPRRPEQPPAIPPAPPDTDPPDNGAPLPPPPTTGLPDLLTPHSGQCRAPAAGEAPGCGQYGTAVNFVDDPTKAAALALKEKKLLFVLHVAGNFEDSHFT